MALPKEPRQKMINLMYLVLTALLALNVSNEILNAFKVVDNSLISSNTVIKNSNALIAASLAEQGKKPELAAKVAIWQPRADQAIGLANAMAANIESLKVQLKTESGLEIQDGVEVYKEDDLEAPTRLFGKAGKGLGQKLQDDLQKFVNELNALVPKGDAKQPLPNFPIDLSVPKTRNKSNRTWTDAYFHMTPTVAAITILSKFQNDVLRSGNLLADFCQSQIGKVEVVYDKFEILTSQSSNYLLPGQPLEIKAGIGTFSSAAKPTISINGVSQTANDSGFARYNTTVSNSGSIPITVSFKDPNTGEVMTKNTTVSYTVGQASGASIFLEKMNVMYQGVDNPLTISSGSGKRENAKVSFTGGSIASAGGDKYIAKPTQTGPATVSITVDGKSFSFPIRCKLLPDPVPLVGTQSGGKSSSASFKQMGGLRAQLKDSEFEAPFQIISYTLAGNGAGFQQYTPVQINGGPWGSNAVISQCKPGSTIFIDDIIAKGPDGKSRKLPSIAFQLQ
jgi:gliding motility-associated protein GldM